MPESPDPESLLTPAPRHLQVLGDSVARPPADALHWRAPIGLDVSACLGTAVRGQRRGVEQPAWLECRLDPQRPRDPRTAAGQSYFLKLANPPDSRDPTCLISSGSIEGLRYGLATFRQLLTSTLGSLPALAISDEPAFAVRGAMLDVSRDRVPTMDEFTRIIDSLAALKINHLQFYTEHTFAYTGHEDAWQGWSPITPDEVRTLDTRCQARGIALAANQNCFGHLAHWLRLPKYRRLAETHGDWKFDHWPRSGPFSLCPIDPESERFVQDLLGQLLPCFSSPLVNIGCDETFDVGFGRSASEVQRRGRAAVYLEFVSKVAAIARRHAKRPMFWADIALNHPESVGNIPDDLIALAWGYEPDSPFSRWCEQLAPASGAAREVWVCPGTSSWRSITGRTAERHGNLAAAAAAGRAHGVRGYLICDWGDTGHWQQWPIAAHAIAHGAHAAWTGEAAGFNADAASLALGFRAPDLGPWLEKLGDADLPLREVCLPLSRPPAPNEPPRLRNQSALFIDLFKSLHEQTGVGPLERWHGTLDRLNELTSRKPAGLSPMVSDELDHTLALARFAARRAIARRAPSGATTNQRKALVDECNTLRDSHRRLWAARSRPGGLDHSCSFWDQVRAATAPNLTS